MLLIDLTNAIRGIGTLRDAKCFIGRLLNLFLPRPPSHPPFVVLILFHLHISSPRVIRPPQPYRLPQKIDVRKPTVTHTTFLAYTKRQNSLRPTDRAEQSSHTSFRYTGLKTAHLINQKITYILLLKKSRCSFSTQLSPWLSCMK